MATASQPTNDQPTLPPAGEADPRAALVPASRVKFRAADLLPGHVYRFNLKGKYGCAPYTFLERTADGTYKFKQLGTGYDWRVAATIVTRYLAGEEPDAATSAAEIIFQETPSDSCELGSNEPSLTDAEKKATVDEFSELDKEVYTKADELADEYQTLMERFNGELLPLCDRMQSLLSQRGFMHIPGLPSWSKWRDRLIAYLQQRMKMSLSQFKRRLKEYQDGTDLTDGEPEPNDPEPEPDPDDDPAPVVIEPPKERVTKWIERQRKTLLGGDGPIDADPIRGPERRIDTALRMLDEFELQIDDGLLDPVPQVASLRHEINQHQRDTKLRVVPLHLHQANALVAKLHRHHSPIRVAKFSIGAMIGDKLIGAAICMRPASRALDDGKTIEVARVAVEEPTDGPTDPRRNCCSFLYSACARISREMGFFKIQSYILQDEPGMTLRGAGWVCERTNCGGTKQGLRKNRPNGHKITPVTLKKKQRWAKILNTQADKKAASSVTPTVESQKKPVASLRALPSPTPCGGCKDMHAGIAEMAKANPGMSDEELATKSGCNVTIVRQSKVRYLLDWNKETA